MYGNIENAPPSPHSTFFQLPLSAQPYCGSPPGFDYDLRHTPGHVLASDNSSVSNLSETCVHTRALLAAAHLAHFIRLQIKNHIGLTSSAGISRNKLLSKLVANVKSQTDRQSFWLILVRSKEMFSRKTPRSKDSWIPCPFERSTGLEARSLASFNIISKTNSTKRQSLEVLPTAKRCH